MRRIWTILLALPLVFASCSDMPEADTKPAAGTIEVSIGSGPKIDIQTEAQTRTELDEDGESVRWADNDQIALWAVDSQGQTTIGNQVFRLWHYNAEYNTAKFTATVPVMPEDTYTYYAVSPAPFEASSLQGVRYRIPAGQDGTFNGDCDIMVAHPIQGPALQQGDNSEAVNLEFEHKVHVLKISIPSNNLGEDISKITLTFPEPVAGILTVNAADPAAAPQLTSGSNILTLTFDTPKKPGDTVFAIIAPVEIAAEQSVTITATGTTRESRPREFAAGKHFAAGHTTPIAFNIPTVGPTTLRVSLPDAGAGTLGENITSFTLTAAEGVDLGNGSNVRVFPVTAAGNFDFGFEEFPESLAGQPVAVSYESENTLLSGSFTIPDLLVAGGTNTIATLSVPYLLEEDFSGVNGDQFDDMKGNGNGSGYALTDMGLPGWSGQRIGSQTGTAVRINSCHYCSAVGSKSKYNGSLTSSPLSGLKPNVTVNVKVTFHADRSSNNTLGYFGTTTATGNPTYNNSGQSSVSANATQGGYDNIATYNEFTFSVTSVHRLSWNVTNDDSSGGFLNAQTNRHYLYVDNVKVSIVK